MTYHEYRENYWRDQGGAETYKIVDFGNNTLKNGDPLNAVYLQPKKILFYKDIWHCPSPKIARDVAQRILGFGDIRNLELRGSWVWVDHHVPSGGTHILEGQETDDRKIYRGR